MRTRFVASLLALPLLACATDPVEEHPLDEIIQDGKQDGFNYPTKFGPLFTNTWQYGLLDPAAKLRTPAWTFYLEGPARVTVASRQAPTDDPWVTDTVVYLYKQRDAGTWRRIAKSDANGGFGAVTRDLEAGAYQAIVKGMQGNAEGEFMLRLGCEGPGCLTEQCLFGDSFYALRQLKHGVTTTYKQAELTSASTLSPAEQAQIIAAVQVSSLGDEVTSIEEAFAAVDQGEINRFGVYDSLAGRSFVALEYGAGDSSYGAFFEGEAPVRVAEIGDGEIRACTAVPRTCILGRTYREAEHMPELTLVSRRSITKPTQVNRPFLEEQILVAVNQSSYEASTLAEAFAAVDQGELIHSVYRHTDGRELVAIEYGAGDNSYGAFFAADSTTMVASIGDGDLYDCTAW